MVDQPIELIAKLAGQGSITVDDVRAKLPEGSDAKKILYGLAEQGFIFRIAHGRYALPDKEELSDALSLPQPPIRLAAWLHRWLQSENQHQGLPSGLDWPRARFVGLALHKHAELRWEGPELMVPIEEDAERIRGLHHNVSIFAYDPANEAQKIEVNAMPTLLPHRRDLARVLLVHQDPRLQEAGQQLQHEDESDDDAFDILLDRTDPPMPFPDAKLPRGPPFRYRVLAPRAWVNKNLEHAHPHRHRSQEEP